MKLTRTAKVATTLSVFIVVAGALVIGLQGCSTTPPVSGRLRVEEGRSQKLMVLAAEEAVQITDPDTRLTRQLNLADTQINRGWTSDAQITLAAVRKTLASPEAAKLNDHARISGWVSASQLARRTNDLAGAGLAADDALKAMEQIEDPARRCQYVMGLSNELQYIRGGGAAIALLIKAGPWTKSIDSLPLRRQAVVAFATALFNLDDFSAGQMMLRQEGDAAWRSDVLASMAQTVTPNERQQNNLGAASADLAARSPGSLSPASQPYFGKTLNYEQVFQNQRNSLTGKD